MIEYEKLKTYLRQSKEQLGNYLLTISFLFFFANCSPPVPVYEDGHLYIQHSCAGTCDSERSKMESKCYSIFLLLRNTSDKDLSTEEINERKQSNESVMLLFSMCMHEAAKLPSLPRDTIF